MSEKYLRVTMPDGSQSLDVIRFDIEVDGQTETQLIAWIGVPVGFVSLKHKGERCASFAKLFVDPFFREMQVGSKLILQCEKIAKEESRCWSIGLLLYKRNHDLIPFYAKRGYQFSFDQDGDNWVLTKSLLGSKEVVEK